MARYAWVAAESAGNAQSANSVENFPKTHNRALAAEEIAQPRRQQIRNLREVSCDAQQKLSRVANAKERGGVIGALLVLRGVGEHGAEVFASHSITVK